MSAFPSARDAKEFLVAQIVDEAQREGVPLSDLERKMLYFSETHWTLPDMMKINEEFERQCGNDEYEKKIAHLIRQRIKWAREKEPQTVRSWHEAIESLSKEDHYILVMVQQAGIPVGTTAATLKSVGFVSLFAVGAGLAIVILIAVLLQEPPRGQHFTSHTVNTRVNVILGDIWLTAVCILSLVALVLWVSPRGWLNKLVSLSGLGRLRQGK